MSAGRTLLAALFVLAMGVSLGLLAKVEPTQGALSYKRYQVMVRLLNLYAYRASAFAGQIATAKADLKKPVSQSNSKLSGVKATIARLDQSSGLRATSGPGLSIWMQDSSRTGKGLPTNDFLIHDQDLMSVVNDLYIGGAKAVAINGIRVGATTQIRCAGPVISIGQTRVAPPLVVVAVGPPTTMLRQVTRPGGDLQTLKAFGMPVVLQIAKSITVPRLP